MPRAGRVSAAPWWTALIERAKALGYHSLFLSTVRRFAPALGLYRALGFVEVAEEGDADPAIQVDMRLDLD